MRQLKKQRSRIWDEVSMIQRRRKRAFGLGQEGLALRLLMMLSVRYGALASLDQQIREAGTILGVPYRGRGC